MYATLGPFHRWDFLFFVALVLAGLVLVMHYGVDRNDGAGCYTNDASLVDPITSGCSSSTKP